MLDFKLTDPEIKRTLVSIHEVCPTSDVSIVFAQLDEQPQCIHLSAAHPLQGQPTIQDLSISTQVSLPQANVAQAAGESCAAMKRVHAVGSYTKVIIAYAMAWFVELNSSINWKSSAQDVFNTLRERRDGKGATKIRLLGNPTLKQLLCHINGFAPMNGLLFAPDDTFLLDEEEFLRIAPSFTENYYKHHKTPWYDYSNANYIFAAIIIEMGMEKDLQAALKELVFDKLNMNSTTINSDGLGIFRTSRRLVEGYQVSSNNTPTPVISDSLLRDSTESSSMGLRTSMEDLTSFISELLRDIDAKQDLHPPGENPFVFFFGDAVSPAGFVSLPNTGDFQIETPTKHLFPHRYQSTHLGRPRHSTAFKASFKEKSTNSTEGITTQMITHKAGYVDGHSSNVIVFPKERSFLIILANSTGPFDVVHHISRYLVQQILNLKPQVNIPQDSKREYLACSETLRALERQNLARYHPEHKPEGAAGTYIHVQWGQQITIEPDGGVFFHYGSTKRSRTPMALTYVSPKLIRILVKSETLAIEGWSVWRNMDFKLANKDGHDYLIHNRERWIGNKVEVVENVYRKVSI